MDIRQCFDSITASFTLEELKIVDRYLRYSSYLDYLDFQRLPAGVTRGEKMALRAHMDVTNQLASEIELYVSSLSESEN